MMEKDLPKNADFPSHLIETEKKDKKWISQYIKAAWRDFGTYYPNQLYNGRENYHEIKLYMLGKQSVSRYKKLVNPSSTANEDQSTANISWDILPIIPKFRRIALATLTKSDYNISVDAIDPIAQDDKNKFYADNAARLVLKDEFQKQGVDPSLVEDPEVDAASLKELDMYMSYSYKHRMAVEMEQAIDLILNLNNFEQERALVIEDLHDFGIGGYKEYFDAAGNIKVRRINPFNMVMSYTTNPSFKDVQYMGEVVEMTISDLKELAGDEISEEQYEMIAEKYTNKLGNPTLVKNTGFNQSRNYDGFRISVLDIEFYSVNNLILEERINSKGNVVVGRAAKVKPGRKDKKYSKTDYKVVYQGKWIVDSDVFFDCKLATNMKRAKSDLTNTTLSYHVVAPNIYQMITYSLGSQMKAIADQIQLAWYKLQNVMLRARPRGIMIEIGALENVPIGKGGKAMTPMQIVDLYNQTGNLVYRRLSDEGTASNYKPIEELDNGIGNEANQYFGIITNNIQLLRDILGFNEITDGSTPDPRTLNGVAKYASESTNNSLDFIKRAERELLEKMCYNLTLRIQDSAENGTIEGYIRSLGSSSVQFFKLDPNVSAHECGLIVSQKPTEFEKEKLAQRINLAIQSGQITLADAIMLENLGNMKYAEVMLAYKIKKNDEEKQQRAMEQQQMNGQIQMQSAQAAEAAKQQTLQMEINLKSQYLQLEKQLESQLLAMKLQNEAMIEQGKLEGKINTAKIEADSREYIAQIKKSEKALGNKA
jgi:D-ribose pyranose/furanose isomerase RbsD